MEYVYAAMLLHSAENEISEDAVSKVLKAAGVSSDKDRVKALVASLDGVDIADAMTTAVAAPAAAAASGNAAVAPRAAAKLETGVGTGVGTGARAAAAQLRTT